MEFLDPEKERRTRLMLFVGYGLIALAIGIASLVLLYLSSGYSVDKDGDVTQYGLVFVSSQPSGASIFLNGTDSTNKTASKLNLSSGTYILKISANGYRDWQHPVTVRGGDVQQLDYPMLFPRTLTTDTLRTLKSTPFFVTQSLDNRWAAWMGQASPGEIVLYDFKNPAKPVLSDVVLPTTVYTPSTGTQAWAPVEWASNNRHLLLKHDYTTAQGPGSEYVLFDRSKPESSQNLTKALSLQPTDTVSLFDQKPDKFYVYNSTTKLLRSVTADGPLDIQVTNVRAYKTYADNTVLYTTDTPPGGSPTAGKISVVLQQGKRTLILRQQADTAGAISLLDIAEYDSKWYVIVGSTEEAGVYVYKDPQAPTNDITALPAAWRFLHVDKPTFVAFSSNARFILAENGQRVSVYDAENVQTFNYSLTHPLDAPQKNVRWKDGHRLMYVSGGKLIVTDFDNFNTRELQAASPAFTPMFSGDSEYGYTTVESAAAWQMTATPYVVK